MVTCLRDLVMLAEDLDAFGAGKSAAMQVLTHLALPTGHRRSSSLTSCSIRICVC